MAAAASTLTALDALMKNVYLPGLPAWFNQNRPLYARLEKVVDKRRFRGRKFILGAKDSNPQGIGSIAEGGTLPDAGKSSILNMEVGMKHHYAVINLSAQVMEQTVGEEAAFAEAVDLEIGGARDELEHDCGREMVFGAGYGEMGRLAASGAVSGTTLTFQNANAQVGMPGSRFFRKNASIYSFTALSGGSAGSTGTTVDSVNAGAATIVVASNTGFGNSDYVFRKGNRGNTMMGLGGIVDDGTRVTTFQTLSRTSNPLLKANLLGNSGTLRAWTPELMDQLFSESWNNGGGKWPTECYSRLEIQQRAAAYIRADRRAPMGTMTLDNGYKAVTWTTPDGEKPWIVDQFSRPNEIDAIRIDDLGLAILHNFDWEDRDGSMWFRDPSRTHAFEAWLFVWMNMFARQCNNCTALADISHSL